MKHFIKLIEKILHFYRKIEYGDEDQDNEDHSKQSKIQFVVEDSKIDDESNKITNKPEESNKEDDEEDAYESSHSPKIIFHHIDECPIDDTDKFPDEEVKHSDNPIKRIMQAEKLDLEHAHEIHDDEETLELIQLRKEECEEYKQRIKYDSDKTNLDVVKDDEGVYYTIKHSKSPVMKSILKEKSCTHESEGDHEDRPCVFFNERENEIRNFNKNDSVTWSLERTALSNYVPPKEKKKDRKKKGKGKNRRMTEEQEKEKEQKKIEKTRNKRKEREEPPSVTENKFLVEVDEDDEDLEACNAPSTRKSKSVEYDDTSSPFHGDSTFSFDHEEIEENEGEDNKDEQFEDEEMKNIENLDTKKKIHTEISEKKVEKIQLKVPSNMAQFERDLRSLKDDNESKRDYLRNIDPKMLKPIIKSSIEIDTIMNICEIFNNCSEQWINLNQEFLISFLQNLTKLDRFDMAVEFCTDDEKIDSSELINKLRQEHDGGTENLTDRKKILDEIAEKFNL